MIRFTFACLNLKLSGLTIFRQCCDFVVAAALVVAAVPLLAVPSLPWQMRFLAASFVAFFAATLLLLSGNSPVQLSREACLSEESRETFLSY